jgi:hypothetical protein
MHAFEQGCVSGQLGDDGREVPVIQAFGAFPERSQVRSVQGDADLFGDTSAFRHDATTVAQNGRVTFFPMARLLSMNQGSCGPVKITEAAPRAVHA